MCSFNTSEEVFDLEMCLFRTTKCAKIILFKDENKCFEMCRKAYEPYFNVCLCMKLKFMNKKYFVKVLYIFCLSTQLHCLCRTKAPLHYRVRTRVRRFKAQMNYFIYTYNSSYANALLICFFFYSFRNIYILSIKIHRQIYSMTELRI